jgi:hypothetical protein
MKLTDHKTESVDCGYAIASDADLREATPAAPAHVFGHVTRHAR